MPKAKKKAPRLGRREARLMRAAIVLGTKRAHEAVARRDSAAVRAKAAAGAQGVVVAEGDSWFDYPFHDVLEILEDDFNFRVESVAHRGDNVEDMAYDPGQLKKLVRAFEHLGDDGRIPRAILLSGGGNDIAGDEFAVLLNHAASTLEPLNENVVKGVVDERLRFAVASLIGSVTELSRQHFGRVVPVLIHGYDNPVPDGRGFLGGFFILPGPWLKPGFSQKGYEDLQQCTDIMARLIARFNAMLSSIAGASGFEHVTYLDLRKLDTDGSHNRLPSAYRQFWANELHPTKPGFQGVARKFAETILGLPNPAIASRVAGPVRARTRPRGR
jgi:hypothetical protein